MSGYYDRKFNSLTRQIRDKAVSMAGKSEAEQAAIADEIDELGRERARIVSEERRITEETIRDSLRWQAFMMMFGEVVPKITQQVDRLLDRARRRTLQ
jgi:hypothetical protein